MYHEKAEFMQNRQMRDRFGDFLQKYLAKCTKEIKKTKIVCEHFWIKIRIIILVTPPIHYIVFLLHPISNKKIPSPEKGSRSLAVLFTLLPNI